MIDPALAGLFGISFAAATLLPGGSELAFLALLAQGDHSPVLLVAVAGAGNVLGSWLNWYLGRGLRHLVGRRWFPVTPAALERGEQQFRRYGLWTLLFAWVPVVGDPLTVAAGSLRVPLAPFLLLVTIGKLARYSVLALATGPLLGR